MRSKMRVLREYVQAASGLIVLILCASSTGFAQEKNGFDLSKSIIPTDRIHHGGPAKDGIPAIDRPVFVDAASARRFLKDDDGVLGVSMGEISRAYPIRILNWHEIVNDRFGDELLTISYCPLCGTGIVFGGRVNGQALDFGVSGLLYNSDVLMYDRQTNSLWSQLRKRAVSGPLAGVGLDSVPVTHTTWADWRNAHPGTRVLSTDTGYARNYEQDPYAGYDKSEAILFPIEFRAAGFHPKERVLGLEIAGQAKAYPFVELGKSGGQVKDQLAGVEVTIRFDGKSAKATAHGSDGRQLHGVVGYWFAWYAFHPDTRIFRADARSRQNRER